MNWIGGFASEIGGFSGFMGLVRIGEVSRKDGGRSVCEG